MINRKFKCLKVDFSKYAEQIGVFRRQVWEKEEVFDDESFPEHLWLDDCDESATHWIVFDRKKIIASARLGLYTSYEETPYMKLMEPHKSVLQLPIASLNRLVVHMDYRRRKISEMLDAVRIEEAKKLKAKTIVGQAVYTRIRALQKFGFEYMGDIGRIKEFPNIELRLMIKHL